jgi:hypothetical protein
MGEPFLDRPAMFSTRKIWALWFLLVFGLFNIYGPALKSYRAGPDETLQTVAARMTPLQLLGVLVRNDIDTARYFSYAQAMLGRPYASYYVRKAEDWRDTSQDESKSWPQVTPERPLQPWRDFSMEYPPGMPIFALLPALLTQDFNTYHLLFALEMELLLTLSVWAAARAVERARPGAGARFLGLAVAIMAATGFLAARRYDACVSVSLGLSVLALAARPALAGAALAFGIVCKGAPILFAPVGALYYVAQKRWRDLAWALGAAVLFGLFAGFAYLGLSGDHWSDAFAYHGARPLQIESTWSALLIFAQIFDPSLVSGSSYGFGSDNVVSAYEPLLRPLGSVAPILATLAIWVWAARALRGCAGEAERLIVVAKAVCALVVAFSALGKVFSPQYLIWLTPIAALACLESSRRVLVPLFAGLILSQIEYPFVYTYLAASLPPAFGLLALARNVALLVWAWRLLAPDERPKAI